jgi:DNA-binding NarL/FixJ family response regulator
VRILIVDDAPVERAALARIFRDLGHEVVAQASDLASALEFAAEFAPDLAVIDGRLAPEGCLEALRQFRENAPAIVLAVVAALGEIELVRAARAHGASGAFRRPLLRTQVEASLRDLISAS